MKALVIVGIVAVALLAIGGAAWLMLLKGPDLSRYEALRKPRISKRKNARMIEVSFRGKPDKVLMGAFSLLFKTYFSLPGVPRGPKQPAPIGRFGGLAGLPTDPAERAKALAGFPEQDWQGVVGLPVPDSVTELPSKATGDSPFVARLATWEYGEVAEILHVGSYDTELPTIARLEELIRSEGYVISGEHEEEYLRGPGTPLARPQGYCTVIRYPVRKAH